MLLYGCIAPQHRHMLQNWGVRGRTASRTTPSSGTEGSSHSGRGAHLHGRQLVGQPRLRRADWLARGNYMNLVDGPYGRRTACSPEVHYRRHNSLGEARPSGRSRPGAAEEPTISISSSAYTNNYSHRRPGWRVCVYHDNTVRAHITESRRKYTALFSLTGRRSSRWRQQRWDLNETQNSTSRLRILTSRDLRLETTSQELTCGRSGQTSRFTRGNNTNVGRGSQFGYTTSHMGRVQRFRRVRDYFNRHADARLHPFFLPAAARSDPPPPSPTPRLTVTPSPTATNPCADSARHRRHANSRCTQPPPSYRRLSTRPTATTSSDAHTDAYARPAPSHSPV